MRYNVPMRLKLDLHPIFNDSRKIEAALQEAIDEAVRTRATEVEIIPGKGSGALKKGVLRFLDRPEVKARYHRVEKDGDNWGRLFVHFRHERPATTRPERAAAVAIPVACACCADPIPVPEPDEVAASVAAECPACGSPNRIVLRRDRRGAWHADATLDYGPDTSG